MKFTQDLRSSFCPGVLCAVLCTVLGTGAWALAGLADSVPAANPGRFEFSQVNRSYSDLATDIAPVHLSGMTVQLESPSHELTIHANELKLVPREDGSYLAELSLRFSGRGELLADIRMAGVPSRLEDELVVPEQTRVLYLRVRFARGAQGYLVTTETMPKSLSVSIESRIGSNLLAVCRQVGLLLGLNCGGLSRAFSEVDLPLPEAGETYLVEYSQLGEEGSRQLDGYLGFPQRNVEAKPTAADSIP